MLATSLFLLVSSAGLTLYLLRPNNPPLDREELSALPAAKTPNAIRLPEPPHALEVKPSARDMATFLEKASPEMKKKLISREPRPDSESAEPVISSVENCLGGLRHSDSLNRFFTPRSAEPGFHQQAQIELERAGMSGVEEMSRLVQNLPASASQERRLAAEFMLTRAQANPAYVAPVRQFFAFLSTQPEPKTADDTPAVAAAEAFWLYLQTDPPLAERRSTWLAAVAAQTEPRARAELERFDEYTRSPASTSAEQNR